MTLALTCERVSVGWQDRTLLADVSLGLELDALDGVLPIIGRTGRGKSTLLYALSGMAAPLAGRVAWRLPDLVAWTAAPRTFQAVNAVRRKRFGFLLQDATMIPCFTVAENLRHIFGLRGVGRFDESLIERSIGAMLIEGETIGNFRDRYPAQLSGGMRQRMALAAAIVHDPQILFADEPTASLDDASGLEVLKVVRHWLDQKPGERAFVFVTHRVETLREGSRAAMALRLTTRAVDGIPAVVPHLEPIP